jgi:hypothetical protein
VSDATVLIISCGALAKEIVELRRLNGWSHIRIQCLPAELHNRPERIPGAVREAIEKYRDKYQQLFVAYGDCGTGGELDKVLEKFDIPRLPGAHCYEFYSGTMAFEALADDEPASFYLTDFLTQHFRRLVKEGLGLDRHPELMSTYFGNYKRLVYLSQSNSALLEEAARKHASNGKADLYLLAGHTRTGRRPGRAQVGFQERA